MSQEDEDTWIENFLEEFDTLDWVEGLNDAITPSEQTWDPGATAGMAAPRASTADTGFSGPLPQAGTKRKGSPGLQLTTSSQRPSHSVFNPFSFDEGHSGPWEPPEIAEAAFPPPSPNPQSQLSATTSQGTLSSCVFSWHEEPSRAMFAGSQSSAGVVHPFSGLSQHPGWDSHPYAPPRTLPDRRSRTFAAPNSLLPAPSPHLSGPLELRQLSAASNRVSGGEGVFHPGEGAWEWGGGSQHAGLGSGGPRWGDGAGGVGLREGQGCSGVYARGRRVGVEARGRDPHGRYRVRSGGSRARHGSGGKYQSSTPSDVPEWLEPHRWPGDASKGCHEDGASQGGHGDSLAVVGAAQQTLLTERQRLNSDKDHLMRQLLQHSQRLTLEEESERAAASLLAELDQLQRGGATAQQVIDLVHRLNRHPCADSEGLKSRFSVHYSRWLIACSREHWPLGQAWFQKQDLSSQHSVLSKAHEYGAGDLSAGEVEMGVGCPLFPNRRVKLKELCQLDDGTFDAIRAGYLRLVADLVHHGRLAWGAAKEGLNATLRDAMVELACMQHLFLLGHPSTCKASGSWLPPGSAASGHQEAAQRRMAAAMVTVGANTQAMWWVMDERGRQLAACDSQKDTLEGEIDALVQILVGGPGAAGETEEYERLMNLVEEQKAATDMHRAIDCSHLTACLLLGLDPLQAASVVVTGLPHPPDLDFMFSRGLLPRPADNLTRLPPESRLPVTHWPAP